MFTIYKAILAPLATAAISVLAPHPHPKVARVVDYIENVGLVGVSWTAEDSERTLLTILEGTDNDIQ